MQSRNLFQCQPTRGRALRPPPCAPRTAAVPGPGHQPGRPGRPAEHPAGGVAAAGCMSRYFTKNSLLEVFSQILVSTDRLVLFS